MKLEIAVILIGISLFFSILYGVDKITSENTSDPASIYIGLSSIDSSSCKICSEGGIFYDSGCKHCIQDGVVLITHVANERFYKLGWSNDNGMYYGDKMCEGSKNFPNANTNENDTYWIEIIKDELELKSNIYTDDNFSNLYDSTSITMCSNPTNLQHIRISNEDGKPAGNGGKLFGYIDDIKIYSEKIDSKNYDNNIFSTTFDKCTNKSCNDKWVLHNTERIFVEPQQHLQFISEVPGTSVAARFYTIYYYLTEFDIISKITGIGFGTNLEVAGYISNGKIMNSIGSALIYHGIIGLLMYVCFFIIVLSRTKYYAFILSIFFMQFNWAYMTSWPVLSMMFALNTYYSQYRYIRAFYKTPKSWLINS